jgi:hypothetical protein
MQRAVHRIFYIFIIYLSFLTKISAVEKTIGVENMVEKNEEEWSA